MGSDITLQSKEYKDCLSDLKTRVRQVHQSSGNNLQKLLARAEKMTDLPELD